MMLSSDNVQDRQSGVSIFEVLISLTVIGLLVIAVGNRNFGPSPTLRKAEASAELIAELGLVRAKAVSTATVIAFQTDRLSCDVIDAPLLYFPDGSSNRSSLCVLMDEVEIEVAIDQVTGLLLGPKDGS